MRQKTITIVLVLGLSLALMVWSIASLAASGGSKPTTNDSIQTNESRSVTPTATSITVNSTADVVDGGDGKCTLREAIAAANNNAVSGPAVGECAAGSSNETDTITFSVTGTITLLTALPGIAGATTIDGPGANLLTVSGNNAVRVFLISNGTSGGPVVSISSLTISGGRVDTGILPSASGGGIYNYQSTLILTSCIISNNRTGDDTNLGGFGGAIHNLGTMTLTNCIVSNNQTGKGTGVHGGGGSGGGIFNVGLLTIRSSTISNNRTGDGSLLGGRVAASLTWAHSQSLTALSAPIVRVTELIAEAASSLSWAAPAAESTTGIF